MNPEKILLPAPAAMSMPLEEALQQRRSHRSFSGGELSLESLSALLFAAQGVTKGALFRTAPSAGALYPLDTLVVCGEVAALPVGVYHYHPRGHELSLFAAGDARRDVAEASLHQAWMASAQAIIVICAEYARITSKYGERGVFYAHTESGNVGQNLSLACAALGLGAAEVGAFHDNAMAKALGLDEHGLVEKWRPLLAIPVGLLK